MKENQKHIFFGLAVIAILLTSSCIPHKQTSVFTDLKKEADTLVVFTPVLKIFVYDYINIKPDPDIAEQDKKIISQVAGDLLDSRYVIKHIELSDINEEKLATFCDLADNSPNVNLVTWKQTFMPELKNLSNNKLGILVTYHAQYNSMAKAIDMNSMAGTSTLSVNLSARPYSDLRLIVFNIQTDEIVFYNKYDTRSYSPARATDVEVITRKLLRDVYYK